MRRRRSGGAGLRSSCRFQGRIDGAKVFWQSEAIFRYSSTGICRNFEKIRYVYENDGDVERSLILRRIGWIFGMVALSGGLS